jgi:SAM-dependent methyltransferase
MTDIKVQGDVRQFYDRVGWQMEGDFYQNARYEDLRAVSADYIRDCHLRVGKYLKQQGCYLLDAGSGPIQYPEYLTYSKGYRYRVCVDISFTAVLEARKRIGGHGLFVVADVANLPFKPEIFEGIVSLHTFHHLPRSEQKKAYQEVYRVLVSGCSAVVVNGWADSLLMRLSEPLVILLERVGVVFARTREKNQPAPSRQISNPRSDGCKDAHSVNGLSQGTYIKKLDADGLRREISSEMQFEIFCWRSVSVRFLRAVIHQKFAGRFFLRKLFALEESYPHFFGEKGQYPLIVISKPE